jgi:heme ABC exporter ATP-binding subunit CcmA
MSAQVVPEMMAERMAGAHKLPTVETPSAVVVAGLRKSFDPRPVLREVSFTLAAGRCLALLGPNGAGKTTLLRILATLAKPSEGRATVLGLDVAREASQVRRVVGFVGHAPMLYDELTVRENLRFFARMYGLRDGAERAEALLARVGMRARANERVRQLSRGQLQRVALARGILHDPALLLLDEPDTGLDEEATALLAALVAERGTQGQTTILTTHQLARGLALADEALVLVGGRVAYAGDSGGLSVEDIRALYERPRAARTAKGGPR